jgi:hypothetical protein
MSDNGSQVADRMTKDKLSERAFWIAFRRALLSLAAAIKRYKIQAPIDD